MKQLTFGWGRSGSAGHRGLLACRPWLQVWGWFQSPVFWGVPGGWGSGVVALREHSSQAGPGQHALITQATRRACSSPTARLSLCENWGVDPEPTAGMGPKETQYWRPSSLFSSVCFFYSITAISVSLRRGHSVKSNLGISLAHSTMCLFLTLMSKGLHCSSESKEPSYNTEDPGSVPGLGRWKWQPTPVFLPGNTRDRGAWWATIHGVTKGRTWLSD